MVYNLGVLPIVINVKGAKNKVVRRTSACLVSCHRPPMLTKLYIRVIG